MKKWKIVTLCALVLGGVCFTSACVSVGRSAVPVYAETEEVQEPVPQEEAESKVTNFVNTFLVPILSGVSLTSIVGMIVSITFACLNRKNNKEGKKNNEETNANCTNILNEILKLLDKISKSENFEEESKIFLKNLMEELKTVVTEATKNNEQIAQLKSMLVIMCEMFNELASSSKEAISSGASQKISELQSKIALIK